MKKLLLIFTLFIGFSLSGFSQHYSEGSWYLGPELSGGFHMKSLNIEDDDIEKMSIFWNAGAYVGYSLTDLIGFQVDIAYNGMYVSEKSKNIIIPAMVTLQFSSHQHLGIGLMYRYCIESPKSLDIAFVPYDYKALNNTDLSVVLEFSTLTNKIFSMGRYTIVTDELTKQRAFIRAGYSLTKGSFTLLPREDIWNDAPTNEIKFSSFFIEFGLRYDFISLFSNDSNKKSNKSSKKKSSKSRKR
ncbi:MAG: hypothetical protein WC135_07790 [Bacteroidales bacterium]